MTNNCTDGLEEVSLRPEHRYLAEIFRKVDVEAHFSQFKCDFAYYEDNGKPYYFPSYVPFIGKAYQPGGILIYAKAQNLAGNACVRQRYFEMRERAIFRLCGGKNEPWTYTNLDIAPVECGVLPALAGVYMYAHGASIHEVDNLEHVTSRLAITNFYKFSLWKIKKHPVNDFTQRDMNPRKYCRVKDFSHATYHHFVSHEINRLKPGTILCLKGHGVRVLRKQETSPILEINDPAWILRGGGGHLKAVGSWGRIAAKQDDPKLIRLVESYCDQIRSTKVQRYTSRLAEIKVYLIHYFQEFKNEARKAI